MEVASLNASLLRGTTRYHGSTQKSASCFATHRGRKPLGRASTPAVGHGGQHVSPPMQDHGVVLVQGRLEGRVEPESQ